MYFIRNIGVHDQYLTLYMLRFNDFNTYYHISTTMYSLWSKQEPHINRYGQAVICSASRLCGYIIIRNVFIKHFLMIFCWFVGFWGFCFNL